MNLLANILIALGELTSPADVTIVVVDIPHPIEELVRVSLLVESHQGEIQGIVGAEFNTIHRGLYLYWGPENLPQPAPRDPNGNPLPPRPAPPDIPNGD